MIVNSTYMKMKRQRPLQLFCVVLAITLLPVAGFAASPWKWNLTLRQDIVGDSMNRPTAMYIDKTKQQYYVVDSGKNRLLSFDRQGELLHILNAGKSLETPYSITRTDSSGIWLTEKGKNTLSYVDFKMKKVVSHELSANGHVVYPDRIETHKGQLYVLDKKSGGIIAFSQKLAAGQTFACKDCAWGFVDFIFNDNKLWALEQEKRTIYRFNLDGRVEKIIPLGDNVTFPVSLTIGPSGFIYVLDRHQRKIAVYDASGSFKYNFLDQGVARGQLYYPIQVRFDPWGRLCIVDEGNARVEIYKR